MTSGIAPYTTSDAFQQQLFADPLKVWTPEELVAFEQGQPAEFAPGEGWHYSNTNYVLLGMVIEQVTGQSIADVFQERLFGPLGMTDTSLPRLVERHRRSPSPRPDRAGPGRRSHRRRDRLEPVRGLHRRRGHLHPRRPRDLGPRALHRRGHPRARDPADATGLDQPHDRRRTRPPPATASASATWAAGGATTGRSPATPPPSCTTTTSTPRSSSWSTATSRSPARRAPNPPPPCRRRWPRPSPRLRNRWTSRPDGSVGAVRVVDQRPLLIDPHGRALVEVIVGPARCAVGRQTTSMRDASGPPVAAADPSVRGADSPLAERAADCRTRMASPRRGRRRVVRPTPLSARRTHRRRCACRFGRAHRRSVDRTERRRCQSMSWLTISSGDSPATPTQRSIR